MDITSRFMEIVKESRDDLDSLCSIIKEFCTYTGAGALLKDGTGQWLKQGEGGCDRLAKYAASGAFANVFEPMVNLEAEGYKILIFPQIVALNPLGTLLFYREEDFQDEEIAAAKVCAIIVSLKLAKISDKDSLDRARSISMVRTTINSLSYTELIAVTLVFEKLEREGLIVARKIADEHSLTRSVIVSALRKLEGAGIIEARSLGMKGTHIKVLNELFISEIKKLKG